MRALIAGFHAAKERPVRKLALACQNLRHLTAHAGRCRRFLIFDLDLPPEQAPQVLALSPAQTLFMLRDEAHPLDGIDLLIAASIGAGVCDKLARRGIRTGVSTETDPDEIVRQFRAGHLVTTPAEDAPAGRRGMACRANGG